MISLRRALFMVILAMTCIVLVLIPAQVSAEGKESQITAFLNNWFKNTSTVGLAVGIVDSDSISYYMMGKRARGNSEAITRKSVFEIGSITKLFATYVLMDMVDKGIFGLDDPIARYLPISLHTTCRKITFRHLATHTSGLPRMPTNFVPKNPDNPYADYDKEHLYTFLENYEPLKKPGDTFEYSNLGVGLLGHVLGEIMGKTFEELALERICKPLNMHSTGATLTARMRKNLVQGYEDAQPIPSWDFKVLSAAGALRSNVEEMVQFLLAHMGHAESSMVRIMKACHVRQYTLADHEDIGLGWMLSHNVKNGTAIAWHSGATGGYTSFIGFNSVTHKGVVILTNAAEPAVPVDKFGMALLNMIDR